MTAIVFGSGGTQTGVSLTGLGTIATGGTGISAAVALPYVSVTGAAGAVSVVMRANLQLNCTSFTPSTPGYLGGVWVTSDDGTNYDPYWVSNNQLFPLDATSFSYPLQAAATTLVRVKGIILPDVPPGGTNAKLVIFNFSGVSITVSSAAIYPAGDASG